MSIEKNFDIPFIASLALREKQIQQNYRPIIAVHKWFARRPGTLFRGLLLSEFGKEPLSDLFYRSNDLKGIKIADPFMGGGTPLFEANRLGCDVVGVDINPMACWIVREEIEHIDLEAYQKSAEIMLLALDRKIGHLYRTRCSLCHCEDAHVKYFLWVKTCDCVECGKTFDLFPGYRIAKNRRHPKDVLLCPQCGELNEVDDPNNPGECQACQTKLILSGPAKRNSCLCSHCGTKNKYPNLDSGPPNHRMIAMEYHCPQCKPGHTGRFFKKPNKEDIAKYREAKSRFQNMRSKFIPDEKIPTGDETTRLLRWGYKYYKEMFNPRQLLCLELSARLIFKQKNARIRDALATNLSDLLRYQNMLCRYDAMALKSLDIFSIHGFPVGLLQCESNFLGIKNDKGLNVGSGGWTNIITKYAKAKDYCDHPFEARFEGKRKVVVPVNEWIGERKNGLERSVKILCQNATDIELAPQSLDAVFTDPPYFGNVQYAELMDFCFVWLRKLLGRERKGFARTSTRNPDELTGNATLSRGLENFATGLSSVFQSMALALKPGRPLVFTFHHNSIEAYATVAMAVLDADMICSTALPCPGEMSSSIHINGTGSSIIDTVFVCRAKSSLAQVDKTCSIEKLAAIVEKDVCKLRSGNVKPTPGDIRCIVFGHLTRMAVTSLQSKWNKFDPVGRKLAIIIDELGSFSKRDTVVRKVSRMANLTL